MKHLRFTLVLLVLLVPLAVFAQDDTPSIDITAALEMLRAEYGEDVLVVEAEYEAERNESCWEFEAITADAMELEVEICTDAETGEVTMETEEEEMDDDADEADDNMSAPSVSIDDAIVSASEAYPDSAIVEVEFEDEEAALTWDVEFADETVVVIDSETGEILSIGAEVEDDDDSDDRDDDDDSDDDDDDGDDDDDD